MATLNPLPVLRVYAFRPRAVPLRASNVGTGIRRPAYRSFADDQSNTLPKAQQGQTGPNMEQAEHVSEEAAKIAKIQGGQGPDVEGQGTPVQDILRNEKDLRNQAPEIMKKDAKKGDTTKPSTSRPFSTLARRQGQAGTDSPPSIGSNAESALTSLDSSMLPTAEQASQFAADLDASSNLHTPGTVTGHKFTLPTLPLPRELVKDFRYDPVIQQVTNLMMVDGKKSVAQRHMATVLNILRTASAPTYNPSRPLLPGAPPASHLPLNPTLYLTLAIDSVAPLLRIRSQKGAAGGGVALQMPVPLALRQRRRQGFMWILDAAKKRKSRGSGNDMFAQKVAEEIIAVVEGRSSVWEKRQGVHRLGTTTRANLNYRTPGRR